MKSSRLRISAIGLAIFLAAILIFSFYALKPADSEQKIQKWEQALLKSRSAYQALAAKEKADSLQEIFVRDFSKTYPILTDWLQQDQETDWESFFRTPEDAAADVKMIENVIAEISLRKGNARDLQLQLKALKEEVSEDVGPQLLQLYLQACERRRELRLSNFLSARSPILFAQHHNFKMSFIGYTEGLSDARHERFFKAGAKLSLLTFDGLYGKVKPLIDDPHGTIRDVDVSPDGKRILFAWKKSDRLDDYHIYQYRLQDDRIQQLTHGIGRADYEPVYLPDGDILFTSTRPEQSVPCRWTEISNLYRMNDQGKYLRRLAIDQVHTLYPQVLEDGRILYTRWDYNDRGQNYPHPLFHMNPDGTAQRVYYGGNSWFPTSLLHARAIPGTEKVMAVAAGHHTRQHGKLVVLDVAEGRDEGKGMHFVAPKREVPYERVDRAHQTGDQFRYPYPLNENEFLVSYLPENPKAEYPKYGDDAVYGLYWMDLDGNRELLYNDHEISVGRPVPLAKPNKPQIIPDTVDYRQNTGLYYVHDVYDGVGLKGIKRGLAKKIRVVRLNYRAAGVGSSRNEGEGGGSLNSGPVAIGNGSWDIKEILGDVDIHEDGSALFEVPAMESIYLQVLDEQQRVIQTTRSWDTVRPGEKKACQGCHAKENANFYEFKEENTMAWKHGVQKLQPFYGPTRGFSFIKEIQPILNQKCVSCHDGSQKGAMSLNGDLKSRETGEKRLWSDAYLNLTHAEKKKRGKSYYYYGNPENEVVNWISKMSKPTELEPYSFGAATSKMMHMLEEGHYDVELTREEYGKLAAWLDLLVPFVGEYREANDWSEKEMAFYNYYENKRKLHTDEEVANIKAWLEARQKPAATASNKTEAPKMVGGYRSLDLDLIKKDLNHWQIQLPREAMIDRIELVFEIQAEATSAPSSASIIFSDQSTLLQKFDPGQEQAALILGKPKRTKQIDITFPENPRAQILKAIKVWGVGMKELPHFEDHHPYIQLSSED